MCDFSLTNVKSRPAQVGDKLIVHNFGTGTKGFASADALDCAVCVQPGTEIAFAENVSRAQLFDKHVYDHKVAVFRQINKENPLMHHDAIEMPDGHIVLLNALVVDQQATVLQLPAAPKTEAEAQEQKRLEVVG